jgi:hypothetical protein
MRTERDAASAAVDRLQQQILAGDALCPTCQGHGTMGTGRPDAHGEGEEIGPCPDCHQGFIPDAGRRVLAAEREAAERTRRVEALEGALREVVRRGALPIDSRVSGVPKSPRECAAAIDRCARLVVDHVTDPARAALSGSPEPSEAP